MRVLSVPQMFAYTVLTLPSFLGNSASVQWSASGMYDGPERFLWPMVTEIVGCISAFQCNFCKFVLWILLCLKSDRQRDRGTVKYKGNQRPRYLAMQTIAISSNSNHTKLYKNAVFVSVNRETVGGEHVKSIKDNILNRRMDVIEAVWKYLFFVWLACLMVQYFLTYLHVCNSITP